MARWTDAAVRNLKCPDGKDRADLRDPGTPGLYLRISAKTGRKIWRCLPRIAGKQMPIQLGEYPEMGLSDARAAYNDVKKQIVRGVNPRDEAARAKAAAEAAALAAGNTVAAVAEKWFRERERKDLAKQYLRDTRLAVENHVFPRWGKLHITEPQMRDCIKLIEDVSSNGTIVRRDGKVKRWRGGKIAADHLFSTLRSLFRYAKYHELRPDNPMLEVERPGRNRPNTRVLDPGELHWLLLAADKLPLPYGPYITTLLYTGSRRGEVLHMRWRDLDIDAEQPLWMQPRTKNGKEHVVALTPPIVQLLNKLSANRINVRAADGRMLPSEFVFCGPEGRKPFYNINGLKRFTDRQIVNLRGAPFSKPWTLHDLRRSMATHTVRLGISEFIVGKCLNHAPKGITGTTYALYAYLPEKQRAWSVWSDYLQCLLTPPTDNIVPLRA